MSNLESIKKTIIPHGINIPPGYETRVAKELSNHYAKTQLWADLAYIRIRLKEERESQGLSMRAVASATRVAGNYSISAATISRIENGGTQNIYAYTSYANALGMRLDVAAAIAPPAITT